MSNFHDFTEIDLKIDRIDLEKYLISDILFQEVNLRTTETNLMNIDRDIKISGHTHPVDVVILVTNGLFHLTVDDKETEYKPGSFIFIEKNRFHTVRTTDPACIFEFWNGIDFW